MGRQYDLTIDYSLQECRADSLCLRFRTASADPDGRIAGGDDFLDLRVIINYEFEIDRGPE